MEDWKKEYDNIKVPEEMREKLEQSINRAKEEKKRMKKITLYKTFGSMAAVLAIVLILPNTSQTAAAAMQQIPLLGNLFKITMQTAIRLHRQEHLQMPSILISMKKLISLLKSSKKA